MTDRLAAREPRDLDAERERWIERHLATAPPLTDTQIEILRRIWRPHPRRTAA